jgi:LAO/AO transport system kinase
MNDSPTDGHIGVKALSLAAAAGDRRALAKAITLIESVRPSDEAAAQEYVSQALASGRSAIRIGLSGPPGVGKSTFIEAFGLHLAERGTKIAVLAVDPSSQRSGGSILGDKTRMTLLARHPNAFIRPSPAGETLGGVARRTREAIIAVEAAGFDVVVVETVGVGQSETTVAGMVDMFVLLMQPGGGDDLQGIKRGIMELADLVVITKADGDLAPAAMRAQADFTNAVHWLRPKWKGWETRVQTVSSLEGRGIGEVWAAVSEFAEVLKASGDWTRNRDQQRLDWLWSDVKERLVDRLRADPAVAALAPQLEAQIRAGALSPSLAAKRIVDAFTGIGGTVR